MNKKGNPAMIWMETERLIIRDYIESDEAEYISLKRNERTMYYLHDIKLHSQQEGELDFRNMLIDQIQADRKFYFLNLVCKDTMEQIGSMGYTVEESTPVGKIVHLGYFLKPEYWNRGYATEALKRILGFAFRENGVYRITTGCLLENAASERVMIKCGMVKEAEHIEWEWHDGQMKTRLEYRLLKKEWHG